MAKTISDFKVDLQGAIHGASLNKVQGVDQVIYRAAGDLLLDIDPIETRRISPLSPALFDQVFDYVVPSDLKGKKVIDIRPQVSRGLNDSFSQRQSKEFDLYKAENAFSVQHNTGVKSIRIAKSTTPGSSLNEMEDTDDNGTWAIGGTASSLAQDTINRVSGGASLRFTATGAGAGFIENSTMAQVDLSTHKNQASLFIFLFIPTVANLTSVNLRWGSDSSNYYDRTVTSAHPSNTFVQGWNLLRFDWDGASVTGAPVDTAIDYLRVTVNHTATDNNYRVDNIVSILPTIFEIEYYSKFLFRDSDGNWQETIDDDSNFINLDTESYNLLLNKTMILLAPQLQGVDSGFDLNFYLAEYQRGIARYTDQYKSEAQKPQSIYYRLPVRFRSRRSRF